MTKFSDIAKKKKEAETKAGFASPVQENQLNVLIQNKKITEQDAQRIMDSAHPFTSPETLVLIESFLALRRNAGTPKERALYATMTAEQFVTRLMQKRPLTFMGAEDFYILRDGKTGKGGFDAIGTESEKEPLVLAEYLSYSEMAISAQLGISSQTYFINNGNRFNAGKPTPDNHETHGMSYAMVGARLEVPGKMEWQHMVIDATQNTAENGYGRNPANNARARELALYQAHYNVPHFATYNEAKADYEKNGANGRYIQIQLPAKFLNAQNGGNPGYFKGNHVIYLDKNVYKEYMRQKIEAFLSDFNANCGKAGKKGYAVFTGLGLGVWALDQDMQGKLMAEAFINVLQNNPGKFPHIADVHFAYMNPGFVGVLGDKKEIHGIKLHASKYEPATELTDENKGKLVGAVYAWDSNAIVGNEYWAHQRTMPNGKAIDTLTLSGDPATVAATANSEIQNPLINDRIAGQYLVVANANEYQLAQQRAKSADAKPVNIAPNVAAAKPEARDDKPKVAEQQLPPKPTPPTQARRMQRRSGGLNQDAVNAVRAQRIAAASAGLKIEFPNASLESTENGIIIRLNVELDQNVPRKREEGADKFKGMLEKLNIKDALVNGSYVPHEGRMAMFDLNNVVQPDGPVVAVTAKINMGHIEQFLAGQAKLKSPQVAQPAAPAPQPQQINPFMMQQFESEPIKSEPKPMGFRLGKEDIEKLQQQAQLLNPGFTINNTNDLKTALEIAALLNRIENVNPLLEHIKYDNNNRTVQFPPNQHAVLTQLLGRPLTNAPSAPKPDAEIVNKPPTIKPH